MVGQTIQVGSRVAFHCYGRIVAEAPPRVKRHENALPAVCQSSDGGYEPPLNLLKFPRYSRGSPCPIPPPSMGRRGRPQDELKEWWARTGPGSWPPPWRSWSYRRPGRLAPVRRRSARRGERHLFGCPWPRSARIRLRPAPSSTNRRRALPNLSLPRRPLIAAQLNEPQDAGPHCSPLRRPVVARAYRPRERDRGLQSVDLSPGGRGDRQARAAGRAPTARSVSACGAAGLVAMHKGRSQAGPRSVDRDLRRIPRFPKARFSG